MIGIEVPKGSKNKKEKLEQDILNDSGCFIEHKECGHHTHIICMEALLQIQVNYGNPISTRCMVCHCLRNSSKHQEEVKALKNKIRELRMPKSNE